MPNKTLNSVLETVWQQIGRGVADRAHPARHPTLATIGPDGPSARTVVLRAARRDDATLEFHTDSRSPKCDHIRSDPRVSVHVWIPKRHLQLRLSGDAHLLPGDADLFARLPRAAQLNYSGPVPGAAIAAPVAQDNSAPEPDRFHRICVALHSIDVLALEEPHHRALFTRAQDWTGQWIAP